MLNNEVTMDIDYFYRLLKAKVTGQVINGTLTGCLLDYELEEIYEQIRSEQRSIEQIEQGCGG
jgi:hypothetical protein